MCGICGVWVKSGKMAAEGAVNSMVKAMHHRGPDDSGVYMDQRAGLGMARLSIIDTSSAGHQPMSNPEETLWIVYNGEVYNFKEERAGLEAKGIPFHSNSDTEVVLRLYEQYGDDFLLRLRGMFALAIYDKRGGPGRERLLLARDPVGIKPLLYAQAGSQVVFGSEIKCLLASGLISREIDPIGLRLLLTFGSVYQPHTMIEGVHMLLPAHRMIIDEQGERIERYWSFGLNRRRDMLDQPYTVMVDEVARMMEETVRLQMVSDVPIGAFLSGGVDSSLTVGLMARAAGWRVKTFSLGYPSEGTHLDETDDAQRSALFLGTEHTRVEVNGRDVRDHIERIAAGLDQPSVDGINSYFVSMAARRAVTVAISGTGGDEIFAGYPWFIHMARRESEIRRQPAKAWLQERLGDAASLPLFDRLINTPPWPILHRLRDGGGFRSRYATTYHVFGVEGTARLLLPHLASGSGVGRAMVADLAGIDELPGAPAVERTSVLCLRGYTNNQLLRDIDAVSMSHSLEVRVPFLDVPLFDLVFSLPSWTKMGKVDQVEGNPYALTYRQSGAKKILVDAGRQLGLLRPDIDDQVKHGFKMPLAHWLKNDMRDVLEDALSEKAVQNRGFFHWPEVKRVKQDFLDTKKSVSFTWLLMMIELWCRSILD